MNYNKILAVAFSLFSVLISIQNDNYATHVGDEFIIGHVANNDYKHIEFPRPNFIIKNGGIANFNNIKGKTVSVVKVKEAKDGSLIGTLKLASNKRFFNSHKYVTADLDKAIKNKELLPI